MPLENGYHIGYYIYAPQERFESCGMFSFPHLISAALCIFSVILLLLFTSKHIIKTLHIRSAAIVLTVLEAIKIAHSFIYGDLYLDAWFPLSYCGLFIVALWLSGFGNGIYKRAGEVFISYGCAFAGLMFLIFPTTSLMLFPIWHYFSLYSLLFHTAMIFFGIKLLANEISFTKREYLHYCIFVIAFSAISITLNCAFACNLMNLREPFNIPIALLQNIYNAFPAAYTAIALCIYMIVPILVAFLFKKIKIKK